MVYTAGLPNPTTPCDRFFVRGVDTFFLRNGRFLDSVDELNKNAALATLVIDGLSQACQ